jgi:signal peptidase I
MTHLNRQGGKSVHKMAVHRSIRQFFLPSLTPMFLIRVLLVSVFAYLFFGFLCIPFTIQGISMEPTYPDGGVNFCWRLRYLFSEPKRHDVVTVRFAGSRVMLLKRVVAREGEQVEFRAGKLYVNGMEIEEPYVRFPCDWNLPSRQVEKDCVYVVGDNRSMPIENHHFGQTSKIRIIGVPLW